MRYCLLLGLLLWSNLSLIAQNSSVILFTENGERFTAILNGVRQNDNPETNVKITGLNAEFYKLKVLFESTALGEKNFNLALQPGNENTYVVKKNNKGEYVLRFMSAVPLAEAPRPSPQQTVVVYHDAPVPATATQTTTTTTTTTTSGGAANPDNVNINMGVNVDGMGGSINFNVSGMDAGMTQSSSTTVTHSQTTTSSTVVNQGAPVPPPPPANVVYLPGYTGPVGCPVPMSNTEFSDLSQTISSKSFEESKMTIAKQVLRDRCMFVTQVKQIMMQFSFEQTRLDFAKFAYERTYDIGNYFKVNDAFTFETSIDELNEYIDSRR